MKYLTSTCALALMVANAGIAQAKDNNGVRVDGRGITLEQGDLELNLGGRIHVDTSIYNDPTTLQSGITDTELRRARVELSGKFGGVLRFGISRELAGTAKGWRNVWAAVEPVKNVEIRGGNFMVPFSIEDMQSSNSMPFVERSLASGLTPGYGLGGAVSAGGKNWSASVGYFTDPLANDNGRSPERGDGFAGRVTAAPINSAGKVLHLALAGEKRTFSPLETLRFSGDAGSAQAPSLMSSRALTGLDNLTAYNAELGGTFGPLQILALSTWAKIKRLTAADVSFSGQTVQAAWLVTGGRYRYTTKGGVIGGPDLGKKGAVEIAARYSRLDLDDATVRRGTGRALSGGANWYLNNNLRIMADYTNSRVTFANSNTPVNNDVFVGRFQINF